MGGAYVGKMAGNVRLWPTLKERSWLYIKRLANDCTFIGFRLI